MSERRERGIAAYARIFDVPQQTVPAVMEEQVGSVFADEAFTAAGGTAWGGQLLTDRDRAIAVLTALIAQGVFDDRLSTYAALAGRQGLDLDALSELMVLLAGYLGYARTSLALHAIREATPAQRLP